MADQNNYVEELNKLKSLLILTSLQQKLDVKAFEYLNEYSGDLHWELHDLMVDEEVWEYVVHQRNYKPQLVFCHPTVLKDNPITSLYYRALAGLSLKAARVYIGAVEPLERGNPRARLNQNKALKMAQIYNTYICSSIKGSTDWTLENGRRMIVANLGITLDGQMRNKIGALAEDRVRRFVLQWLIENNLIIHPILDLEQLRELKQLPSRYLLKGEVEMKFGSDPDISFSRHDELLAILEIKGGVDLAGALERYGAAQKTFRYAISTSRRCKNYYLAAVSTPEIEARIKDDRLVERAFDIISFLSNSDSAKGFFEEIFHHTLRLI